MLTVYKQLSLIFDGAETRLVDGPENRWIYGDGPEDDGIHLGAHVIPKKTIDPSSGLPIDWMSWSIWARWRDFEYHYSTVESVCAYRRR